MLRMTEARVTKRTSNILARMISNRVQRKTSYSKQERSELRENSTDNDGAAADSEERRAAIKSLTAPPAAAPTP
eukprot:6053065-Pyramimonas_sp.AAC.1